MTGLRAWLASKEGAFVPPDYDGGSLVNLPATVGGLLGVRGGWAAPPLAAGHGLDGLDAPRVLLLVIDGLGRAALARHRAFDERVRALVGAAGGAATSLTSVAPSTTSVATTVLLGNGAAPLETGLLGFSQRLPALDVVGNMLFWSVPGEDGGLERRGLRPETFLPSPSLFQTLAAGGVPSAAFLPAAIARSPLSRLQFRGAPPRGTPDLGAALAAAERFLRGTTSGLAYVYTPDLDTVSHREGPETEGWRRVLDAILAALEGWVRGLRPFSGPPPWLLITADHGLQATPPGASRRVGELDGVGPLLASRPGGEPRHVYLYAKPGAAPDLRAAASRALGPDFVVLDGREARAAGLYGDPSRAHPEAAARVGDVVVLARGGVTLWPDDADVVLPGMHGSLEADEMLVPLLALPLG